MKHPKLKDKSKSKGTPNNYVPGSHGLEMRSGGMSNIKNMVANMGSSSNPFNNFTK